MTRETTINLLLALLLLGLPLSATALGEPFYVTLATRVVVLALAATGLNLALGLGGLISFGHAAFFGLGGYVAGILATHAFNAEPLVAGIRGTTSMPIIWLTAVVIAGLVALPIGIISLRTTGIYFIMITLAFAQMIYYFAISWPAYGGEDGLSIYVRNAFPGINTTQPLPYFLVCFAVLMATLLLFRLVEGSRLAAPCKRPGRTARGLPRSALHPSTSGSSPSCSPR